MRLVFAGTPTVAVPTLRRLAAQHEILVVVTRPDAPLGRKRILTPSPVAQEAAELGIPVLKAARLDQEVTRQLTALQPDLGVIVAYGGLVREPLLSAPKHGWINLHFSLLPAWRGAAPVQRALIAGDPSLGATVFQLVPELDAGPIHAADVYPIAQDAIADEALATLARAGAPLTAEAVAAIAAGTARPQPQRGQASYAPKLAHTDARLDWTDSAAAVFARYRGVTSEPGAYSTLNDVLVKVRELRRTDEAASLEPGVLRPTRGGVLVGTGTQPLSLVRVQPAGRGEMAAEDWFRGLRLADGATARLGSASVPAETGSVPR